MKTQQSLRLERRKFLADPLLLPVIILLLVFLALFILYPLTMLMADSVYAADAYTLYAVEQNPQQVRAAFPEQALTELSVARQPVIRLDSLGSLTATQRLGRAASTLYMAYLI